MLCYVLYCCSLHVQAWQLITNFKLSDREWVQTCQGPDLSMCIVELSDLGSVVINLSQAHFLTQSHFSTFVNVRLRSKVSESRFSGPELGSYRLSPLHVNVFCFQLPTPCYCFQYEIFFNNAVSLRLLFLHACNICLILMIFIFYKPTCTCIDDLCNEFLSQLSLIINYTI